jgi:hypothetical protein
VNDSPSPDEIPIQRSNALLNQLEFVSGFSCWMPGTIVLSAMTNGQPVEGEFLVAIPLLCGMLAFFLRKWSPETFGRISREGLTRTHYCGAESVVKWRDIESIRWPLSNNDEIRVVVQLRDEHAGLRKDVLSLANAASHDLAKVIAYMHICCGNAEQHNWPEFCVQHATPLLKSDESSDRGTVRQALLPDATGLAARVLVTMCRYPFIAGLLAPFVFLVTSVILVSRELYWLTAIAIAASATINIRLVWGEWLEPFTIYCLATAVGAFVLGCLASPLSSRNPKRQVINRVAVVFCFFAAIVGGPLIGNAAAKGWLPFGNARHGVLAMLIMLMAPLMWGIRNSEKLKRSDAITGSDMLSQWEEFERTIKSEWHAHHTPAS